MNLGITGASGFIGKRLTREFESNGYKLTLIHTRDIDVESFQWRIQNLADRLDYLIHLGEPASFRLINNKQEALQVLCKKTSVLANSFSSRLIYFSSSLSLFYVNNDNFSDSSIEHYISMKTIGEEITLDKGGRVFRLSNIFGKGMSPQTIIPKLDWKIRNNQPIKLLGDPIRDYLHVNDLSSGIIEAIPKITSPISNFGTGVGTSISNLVRIISDIYSKDPSEFIQQDEEKIHQSSIVLDMSQTFSILDWRPSNNLNQRIKESIIG